MEFLPLPVSVNPVYLTIIPRVRVGYEMVDNCFIKNAHENREFLSTLFLKTRTVTIFGEHGVMAHIP